MGCNCGAKRVALAQAVKARDARRAVAVATSGLKEILTGKDDGVLNQEGPKQDE